VTKILLVGWGYPPKIDGGLDIHVEKLFQGLLKSEHEVDLLLPSHRAPERKNIVSVEASEEILPASSDLAEKAVEIADDYDIIHTHDWFGSEAGLKAKKYCNTSWIATFHSLSHQRSHNKSPEIENLERAAAEKSDVAICVSDSLSRSLRKSYGRKGRVIHNGFSSRDETGRDMKQELGISGPMIFFVGRHAEQKGIEHLIYGFSKLDRDDATLVVGGDGYLREPLEEFVELLGISEDVIFTGYIPDEELGDYYSSADAFVSPSISEPFGLTLTEALEAGTPVVATSSGVEEVLPGDALVKARPESGSIAQGIKEALERKKVPRYSGRSWSDMVEDTREVYSELS
jgi:glycosyltransferase involved in cell wall biosynthesis